MPEDIKVSDLIKKSQSNLSDLEVEQLALNLMLETEWKHHLLASPDNLKRSSIKIHSNLYQDLEIFSSYTQKSEDTIYDQINHTQTNLGNHYLKEILKNPTRNQSILLQRQKKIQNLLQNPLKFEKVQSLLKELKELEKGGLWFWKDISPEFEELTKQVYFQNQFLQCFNQSEVILKFYNYFQIIFLPLYGLIGPILFFVIPYIIVRFFYGINLPFTFYFNLCKSIFFGGGTTGMTSLFGSKAPKWLSWGQYLTKFITIGFYIYGIYNSFYAAYILNNIVNLIHEKVNMLAKFIKVSYQLYQEVKGPLNLEPLVVSHLELWDPLFEEEPYLLSNKGKILRTFNLVISEKEKLNSLVQAVGLIDAHASIASLHLWGHYSYPTYLNHSKPLLSVQQLWNPFLDPKKTIKNNLQIGDGLKPELFKPNNMIITGPNASGKSTFIKSLVLSVLMAQTISISPATQLSLTPFQFLNTYLNIPDVKGRESLFEAEMNRSRKHIDDVIQLKGPGIYSLVVMDEIFNSTNYEEGVAGAYIVAKELGQLPQSLSIITTHFPYLTKLSKTGNFLNYKFEVEKDNGQLKPTYKLKSGISKQHLALDMLEKKGYKPEFVKEARKIFKELVDMTQPGKRSTNNGSGGSTKKVPRSESLRLEIRPQLNRNLKNNKNLNLKKDEKKSELELNLEQKIGKNLDLVCVIENETRKEKILEKIQKAVEEKVSKDLQSDS